MIGRIISIMLILISLLGIGYFVMIGIAPASGINNHNSNEKLLTENTLSVNSDPAGPDTTGTQIKESKAVGKKLSGEVVRCTIYEVEKRIDLRLTSLDTIDQSVNINPSDTIINLPPKTKKRVDLHLPIGISGINIVSTNGDELKLQVPLSLCATAGGESDNSGGESDNSYGSTLLSSDTPITSGPSQRVQAPPPVPELSTMALTGIGVLGLIFIISKSKQ